MTTTPGTNTSVKRLLVIFPGALGDVVCVLPAIEALAMRHRGCAIELMARPELARLAAGRTAVARGHSIDAPHVSALFSESVECGEFFAGYERIYSFFASNDANFRMRLGAATDGEVSFHPFRPLDDGSHEPHIAAAHLRSIGETDAPLRPPQVVPNRADLRAAADALAKARCNLSTLIAIFPGSGSPAKNWPLDRFAALARILSERSSVVFIVGPAESAMEKTLREYELPILNDLDLGTVAGIARLARCFVGNDSGVSHLAAATDAPGVVIFGPSDPSRWRPLGRIAVLDQQVAPDEVAAALVEISDRHAREKHSR